MEPQFGDLTHPLYLHEDVMARLGAPQQAPLRKRLSMVLQQLGAHGRTSVVKGCRDDANRGWLRSPLGGGDSGMQYYLWWSPQGNIPVKALSLKPSEIVIRAVRHHDDHAPLRVGELDDYHFFGPVDIEKEVEAPWTDEQIYFMQAQQPVRLLLGQPGSGKTTVLWKTVETCQHERILYLTWSPALTRCAHERFQSFAPRSVQVYARDFLFFLSEICGYDIKHLTLHESRQRFETIIARLLNTNQLTSLGPWARYLTALFAELRAFLIGRAIPGHQASEFHQGVFRLSQASYLELRAQEKGIGQAAAEQTLKIFSTFQSEAFKQIFPELIASCQAIKRLRSAEIPDSLLNFDRVVIDEIQDLTLLEVAVVIEFCQAVARRRGVMPQLLAAGDDGQTVRPSGFERSSFNELIRLSLGRVPEQFRLDDNLRCPVMIADVIERASALYSDLSKEDRPRGKGLFTGEHSVAARLIHVAVASDSEAQMLLQDLKDFEGLVIVCPQPILPRWLTPELRELALTPADVKGLEYQSVLLLDPGQLLCEIRSLRSDADRLQQYACRTMIDQLRVALSRATETLIFLDVAASEGALKLSKELLGESASYTPEDLLAYFEQADTPPEERILACTQDARMLIDEHPARAWQRACQAVRLLGEGFASDDLASDTLQLEAYQTLVALAARLLAEGVPEGVPGDEVSKFALQALNRLKAEPEKNAFSHLINWCDKREPSPVYLLNAMLTLGARGDWICQALASHMQQIRQTLESRAADALSAREFCGDVVGWLALTGFSGDLISEARRLYCKAFDTLLRTAELRTVNTPSEILLRSAEAILERLDTPDWQRLGALRAVQGRYAEAAEGFEKAGRFQEAFHNWRKAGDWLRASQLALTTEVSLEELEKVDIQWLSDFQQLLVSCPAGLFGRLTKAEQKCFEDDFKRFRKV